MADSDKAMRAAGNEGFRKRVKFFLQKSAVAIVGEVGTTPGHTERLAYAESILDGSASVREMAVAVTTNATVLTNIGDDGGHASVPDSDLEFTVNSMIDDFAGFEAP